MCQRYRCQFLFVWGEYFLLKTCCFLFFFCNILSLDVDLKILLLNLGNKRQEQDCFDFQYSESKFISNKSNSKFSSFILFLFLFFLFSIDGLESLQLWPVNIMSQLSFHNFTEGFYLIVIDAFQWKKKWTRKKVVSF